MQDIAMLKTVIESDRLRVKAVQDELRAALSSTTRNHIVTMDRSAARQLLELLGSVQSTLGQAEDELSNMTAHLTIA